MGSCAPITFNIRKVTYGFKPFFYVVSREIFQCQRCFSLDILNIFNYCLPYCRRVSAETMCAPWRAALGPASPPGRTPGPSRGRVDVQERPGFEPDHEQPNQFATLLNHLFATRLTPEGRPYTLTEVSKGTGLSVPYLSILRKGTIGAVPFQRVAALARFFQVPLDYFSQESPPSESLDEQVRMALAQPLGRDLLLRAGKLGTAQRALVLQMIEHAERVLQTLPTPPDEPRQAPQAEEPDARATP